MEICLHCLYLVTLGVWKYGNVEKCLQCLYLITVEVCKGVSVEITLGSRGYFFLIDTDGSRRSRVNEAQRAEEKKITSGHRSTQPHFHARNQFKYLTKPVLGSVGWSACLFSLNLTADCTWRSDA